MENLPAIFGSFTGGWLSPIRPMKALESYKFVYAVCTSLKMVLT